MDVIGFKSGADDFDVVFFTYSFDDCLEAFLYLGCEYLAAVFGDPDDVVSAIVGCVG